MVPSSSVRNDDYKKLYNFWQELPLIKVLSPEVYRTIDDHHLRVAMVQVLRRGIKENGRKRYAMSLKELREPMEDYIQNELNLRNQEVKLTALYHHRDILLEEGLIHEVATYLEGKRHVTYYGRTARAFIGDQSPSGQTEKKIGFLKTLILELNPNLDPKKIDTTLETIIKQGEVSHNKIEGWVKDHVSIINRLDLDTIQLYSLLLKLDKPTPEVEQAMDEIRSYLDF